MHARTLISWFLTPRGKVLQEGLFLSEMDDLGPNLAQESSGGGFGGVSCASQTIVFVDSLEQKHDVGPPAGLFWWTASSIITMLSVQKGILSRQPHL